MDTTQDISPNCKGPIKKTFTNIFGATVDNTVHNTNYGGELSTSRTSQNILQDIIIIVTIIGVVIIAWRVYLLCRQRSKILPKTIERQNTRPEERNKLCMNKKLQTDIPERKHTIQIE
jgi:large-conductance mechanosensitive channel